MLSGKKKLAAQNYSSHVSEKVVTVPHINLSFLDWRATVLQLEKNKGYYISILGEFYFQQKFGEGMHGFVGGEWGFSQIWIHLLQICFGERAGVLLCDFPC